MGDVGERALAVIVGIGGSGVFVALAAWFGKIWASKILEKDRAKHTAEMEHFKSDIQKTARQLQGQIDRTLFVHRVQFETEFKALTDIWAKVTRLRRAMAALRPIVSIGPAAETEAEAAEALQGRFTSFNAAHIVLADAVQEQAPFYPYSVRQALTAVLQAAGAESVSLRLYPREEQKGDWYEAGEKNLGDLCASADRVEGLIRTRLDELAIVEGGSE